MKTAKNAQCTCMRQHFSSKPKFLDRTLVCVCVCGVVWCGVVWCGVVWCGVVWCGVCVCGPKLILCMEVI